MTTLTAVACKAGGSPAIETVAPDGPSAAKVTLEPKADGIFGHTGERCVVVHP